MKHAFAVALAATLVAGCATAQDTKPAADSKAATSQSQCKPPPKDMVVKDLEVGTGHTVEFRNPVLVNYTGWLYDGCARDFKGAQFDTSVGRVTPFGFIAGIGNVIKGWQQGVIGMNEKGRRLLIIPPDMAYGEKGAGNGKIPPRATLVFEIELLQIVSAREPGPPKKPQ